MRDPRSGPWGGCWGDGFGVRGAPRQSHVLQGMCGPDRSGDGSPPPAGVPPTDRPAAPGAGRAAHFRVLPGLGAAPCAVPPPPFPRGSRRIGSGPRCRLPWAAASAQQSSAAALTVGARAGPGRRGRDSGGSRRPPPNSSLWVPPGTPAICPGFPGRGSRGAPCEERAPPTTTGSQGRAGGGPARARRGGTAAAAPLGGSAAARGLLSGPRAPPLASRGGSLRAAGGGGRIQRRLRDL